MAIGILALQGAFAEHGQMLDRLGEEHFQIRQKRDLDKPCEALILPGGESTVIGKLLREQGLYGEIKKRILDGMPVLGTCAGLILLAGEVEQGSPHLATMSIRARRNAYGRQLGSFRTEADFRGVGRIPMIFIRAPYIASVFDDTQILAQTKGHIVAARQKNQLVCAFHPELTEDTGVHRYFLNMISR